MGEGDARGRRGSEARRPYWTRSLGAGEPDCSLQKAPMLSELHHPACVLKLRADAFVGPR